MRVSMEVVLAVTTLCWVSWCGWFASLERSVALLAEWSSAALAGEGVRWTAAWWEFAHSNKYIINKTTALLIPQSNSENTLCNQSSTPSLMIHCSFDPPSICDYFRHFYDSQKSIIFNFFPVVNKRIKGVISSTIIGYVTLSYLLNGYINDHALKLAWCRCPLGRSKKVLYKSRIASSGGMVFLLKPRIRTASRTFNNLFRWSRLICLTIF